MMTATALRRKSPTAFGRRKPDAPSSQASSLADDVRLFAMFFLGGFTFMGVYLA
ncbi:MAG TPA: hypothetical protein VFO42_09305 [Sphingomicrobium sp.]|nr:hypothetical protein [Sphingomicrobium sp.]